MDPGVGLVSYSQAAVLVLIFALRVFAALVGDIIIGMSWVKEALMELERGRSVDVRPLGGSMRGRIESGQRVTLALIDSAEVQIDDIVFVRWKGNYLLHLVKELTETDALIGNNLGKINGWVNRSAIIARVTAIHVDPEGNLPGRESG